MAAFDFWLEHLYTDELTVGSIKFPTADGTSGSILTTDGAGTLTFTTQGNESLFSELTAEYTNNIDVGDHVKFNSIKDTSGTSIALDVTTAYTHTSNVASLGRFTLVGNGTNKYRIITNFIKYDLLNHAKSFTVQWYDSDTNTAIGNAFEIKGMGQSGDKTIVNPEFRVYYTPAINVRVELRFTAIDGLTKVGQVYCDVAKVN